MRTSATTAGDRADRIVFWGSAVIAVLLWVVL